MKTTAYLPDVVAAEIGSPAYEDLCLALRVLEGWFGGLKRSQLALF